MVELQNIKKVKFQFDETTQLRATAGLSIGMTVGFIATFILIVTSEMILWYKIAGGFGMLCIIGLQVMNAAVAIIRLKAIKAASKAFENLGKTQGFNINSENKQVSYIQ